MYMYMFLEIEIQPGFEPGSFELCSHALTNCMSHWSSGIRAEDRWHLSIDAVRLKCWIFLAGSQFLFCHRFNRSNKTPFNMLELVVCNCGLPQYHITSMCFLG